MGDWLLVTTILISAAELRSYAFTVLLTVGTPRDLAAIVAGAMLRANLAGHDGHGVARLPGYVRDVRDGRVQPEKRAQVVHRRGVAATVSAHWGWGQPAARLAAETAAGIAHDGAAAVVLRDCCHAGWLGECATSIAAHGHVALVAAHAPVTAGEPESAVPHDRANRLAYAIPRGRGKPAIVSQLSAGAPLLSSSGGESKGLAILAEVLGGVLSSAQSAPLTGGAGGYGLLLVALDVMSFCDLGCFFDGIARLAAECGERPGPGAAARPAMLPGRTENETAARRRRTGIPVPEPAWNDACQLADELRVPRPQPVS
jgi:LDH2 family malate/lactate/ureidoglycolate dehydrogenase